ncbi:MAG: ABC transporter ATP-binding protein [Lachnospiraceae bacterium]|nr:ABC transporter ATP-binding protein [Lachnospiraceae bacterium]
MIRLNNVTKIYETQGIKTNALNGISLEIKDGEMIAVMGPSGSGKTTLLNIIGCMDSLTGGKYEYNECEVSALKRGQLNAFRKEHISFVFQNFALMKDYTVYENVELPLLARNISKKERKKIVNEKLELMGISELTKKYATQISGGQQQRCAIARALAAGNDMILADEPTGALDSKTGDEIMEAFIRVNKMGKTVIIITHDQKVAKKCNRVIEIEDGKIKVHND